MSKSIDNLYSSLNHNPDKTLIYNPLEGYVSFRPNYDRYLAPAVICQNIIVPLDASGNVTITPAQIEDGTYTGNPLYTLSASQTTFTCANIGTNNITLTLTENSDNSTTTCFATVTVVDNLPPTATNPADINVQCLGAVPAANPLDVTTEADNCGTPTVAYVGDVSDGNFNPETITRTYSVTDVSGNSINVTQIITVEDTTNPTASNLPAVNVQCAGDVPAVNIADVDDEADNCSGVIIVAHDGDVSSGFNPQVITRTYSVTDASGNSINVTQIITVEDTTNPTTSNLSPVNVQCAGDVPPVNIADVNDEADNCPGTITVAHVNDVSNGSSNPEVITRTYSVTDLAGNSINVTQIITVDDTTPPNAICQTTPSTVQLDASGNGSISVTDVNNGSNDSCGPVNLSFLGGLPDLTNNIAEGKPTFQTSDYSPQGVSGKAVDGDTNGRWGDGSVTHTRDINGNVEYWEVDLQGYFDIAAMKIWNRTDCCSNRLNNFRVTLYDNAVIIGFQDFNIMGNASLDIITLTGIANKVRVTQLNNNEPLSIAEFQVFAAGAAIDFNCSDIGSQTVTLVATDAAGNTDTCVHTVNVVDSIAPIITTCPAPITVSADNSVSCEATGVVLTPPTGTDNCTASLTITNDAPAAFPFGVITTVTWTLEDASGNSVQCTQLVTVEDNSDPEITCPTNIVQNTDAGLCTAVVTFDPPTVNECSTYSITRIDGNVLNSGDAFPIGDTTIEYQVLDDNNLLATCSFTITVEDNEDPTITAPNDITPSTDLDTCGANIAIPNASFTDNCTDSTLTWSFTGATTLTGTGQVGSKDFNIGITTITYTVTDNVGNTATDSMLVTLSDDEDPTITAPADITVSANVDCQVNALSLGAPTTADNCGVASVTHNGIPPYPIGTTIITWTVTDNAGNTSTDTQNVIVVDNTAPTLTVLNPTVINVNTSTETDENCTVAVVIRSVSFNDNCSGSILSWEMTGATIVGSTPGQVPSPFTFNLGVTTITYTVTDSASPANTISKTRTVTVIDDEDPTMSALADITVSSDPDTCGASVSWTEPTATDNCDSITPLQTTGFTNPYTFPIGTTTVSYQATDASGNSITDSFTVTVTDTEAPTISHPNEVTDLVSTTSADGTGNCTLAIAIPNAITNDNCSVSLLSWVISGATTGSGSNNQVGTRFFNVGTSVITYTVSDNNTPALQNTLSINVVVTDDELPTLNLPSDITANGCNTTVTYPTITGNDNCGVASINQIDGSGYTSSSSFPLGTTTLEYEITDIHGNTFIDTFDVTVIDSTLPVINCPSNVSIFNDAGECYASFNYQVVASDDCAVTPTLTWTMTGATSGSGSGQVGNYNFNVGATTVTYTINDGSNTATCSSTVTVTDNESPVLTCPTPSASYNTDLDSCTTSLTFTATATDNCDTPVITYSIDGTSISFPYNFPIGTTVVDVLATTTNGLTDICSFNVVVNDNQAPEIVCPTVLASYPTDSGSCTALLSLPATATDNCTASTPTFTYTISGTPITFPYAFPSGSTTVTAVANDGHGQTHTCNYTVVVNDTQNPIANCVGSIDITLNSSGNASIVVADINNGSTDNCGIQGFALNKTDFDCTHLGSNTVILTVTDTSGNTATCTAIVNVLDPAASAGVEINVDNNPICQDGDIEFTATPINGGASPIYEWFINGISQGTNSPTFQPFTSLNNADEIYVQLQSSLTNCNTPVQSTSIFITVYPTPIVTGPTEICVGASDNLSPSTGGTWSSSNPSIATVNNAGVFNGVSAGVVTFTFTSASGGCTSPINVTINALPVLTAPASVCVGATNSLTPSSGGTWSSSNPAIATVDNAGIITGVLPGFATFTFTDANSCSNTTSSVQVLESPVIDTVIASTNPLCSGETVTIQANLQPLSNPPNKRTLINYNFNVSPAPSGYGAYNGQEIPGITSHLNNSTMTYNFGSNGTATDTNAFASNPEGSNATRSLFQNDNDGHDDDGAWIFNVGGSVLDDYRDFRVYFQTIRNNIAGNPKYIDISYRVNGTGAFIDVMRYDMLNDNSSLAWREVLFSLPADADYANQLEIKLYVNDGRSSGGNYPYIRIDNFQLQGSIGGDVVSYSWTADTGAAAGLPASASVPSTANSIIQVTPTLDTNYTLTVQNSANGCIDTETVLVNVSPAPEIFVTAEYCVVDDSDTEIDESQFVQLVATSPSDPNVTYEWQTNPVQTGSSILVDIADVYTVVGTLSGGCSTSGTIAIAQELVIDGDFTNLDIMDNSAYPFQSGHIFVPNQPGLVPAGQGELYADGGLLGYTITHSGQDVHSGFHGSDHTDNTVGAQNFMAINGDAGIDAWRQDNTPVLPNTTYYFSAWVMRLINGSPPRLQFEVNGVPVGTDVIPPPRTGNGPSGDNWERFYGNWTSGPADTSVNIRIINDNGSAGGNDYAIDDISFATLSTFIRLITPLGTDLQTTCQNTPIEDIAYDIGGGLTPPTIQWTHNGTPLALNVFPNGLGFVFNGLTYEISGTPTGEGIYEYSVETSSTCDIKSSEGILTINEAPVVTIAPIPQICASETTIDLIANLSGSATGGQWSHSGTPIPTITTGGNVATGTYTIDTSGVFTFTFTSNEPSTNCDRAIETVDVEILPYVIADAGAEQTTIGCDVTMVTLAANNATGQWTAVPNTGFFSNPAAYNSTFTGESGTTYILTWTATNNVLCGNTADFVEIVIPNCGDNLIFEGDEDYISFANNYGLGNGSFSMEAWVKPDNVSGIRTIISKRNSNALNSGYDLSLIANRLHFRWNNQDMLATATMNNSRWYHVAVTFNGSNTYTMYIDGFVVQTKTGSSPISNTNKALIGAMDTTNALPINHFDGAIDEVRIWDTALSVTQIREMMNQEIKQAGSNVMGEVIPLPITGGLLWTNLKGYYQMKDGSDGNNVNGGNIEDISLSNIQGTLVGMTASQNENAPLPYISNNNGSWDSASTWASGSVQQIPNSRINSISGPEQTWNIVRTETDVTANRPANVLYKTVVQGLLVDNNKLSIQNDQLLNVTKYLKIDGVLDLEGESQLLQYDGSIVDYAGTGHMERDQQGTSNVYNYNYWGSPVSNTFNALNTHPISYNLEDALYDGNAQVNWIGGYDGAPTTPVSISTRWLYLYESYPYDSYYDWHKIDQFYNIEVGLGFLMKGSGSASALQNYTFRGQPNTGTILRAIGSNDEALLGNPYPSALDAMAVIADNAPVLLDGTIRYWEHAPSNNSHITVEYQGGYAYYNNTGGTAAVSSPDLNGTGDANKIPKRYIPVGQGFMATANASGGNFIFKNSQRVFEKESGGLSIFMRSSNEENNEDETENNETNTQLIRLDFKSPENAVRHLLLGFTPNNLATEGVDYGYDARNEELFPSDMSFLIEDDKYIIQGVGEFNSDNMYPLVIDLDTSGNIEIELTALENFEDPIDVYVYDALLGTYSRINAVNYQIVLDAGSHANRYFITFKEDATLNIVDEEFSNVLVNFLSATSEIYIHVPSSMDIKQVYLVNMLGQTVRSWNATNAPLSDECKIPVSKISEGSYIIKVRTSDNKMINKKIVIDQN
ncbi:hypothetical protein GCM10010976_14470 [Bizionia arctica]|uniref:HYR domain-containing protein n=1 Tax=Bizionia arctica TaxID=1495645 RepID=A0A917GFR9_9FLAO|nr:hypothetical protein GCM10010976_14470 [Bizionia arctica]